MSDSRADRNLAKPQSFETKGLPGGYAPAPTPEVHQQSIDPGYSNSPGPEGDGGGEEWKTSDAAAGKFASGKDSSTDSGVESSTTDDVGADSGAASSTSADSDAESSGDSSTDSSSKEQKKATSTRAKASGPAK